MTDPVNTGESLLSGTAQAVSEGNLTIFDVVDSSLITKYIPLYIYELLFVFLVFLAGLVVRPRSTCIDFIH